MKLKRAKAYRKLMTYLQLNFHFREPYQVLVDEEILLEAVNTKYDLVAGLERTLHGKVKPMITQCAMEHLYRAKTPQAKEAITLAKTFERRRCGHIPPDSETLSVFECLVEVLGPNNKHRYCVATQKPKLRAKFRAIPGVPLIYMNRSVMILEPMSPATEKMRHEIEESKLVHGLNEVQRGSEQDSASAAKKRKGPKGPNPLSVKKRQRPSAGEPEKQKDDASGKKRRKRGKSGHHDDAEHSEHSEHERKEQHDGSTVGPSQVENTHAARAPETGVQS